MLAEQALQQMLGLDHQLVQVRRASINGLAFAEGLQLADKSRRPVYAIQKIVGDGELRMLTAEPHLKDLGVSRDPH